MPHNTPTSLRWATLVIILILVGVLAGRYRTWLVSLLAAKTVSRSNALFVLGDGGDLAATATLAAIDPLKGDLTVRLDCVARGTLAAADGTLARPVQIYVNSVTGKVEHRFQKGEVLAPIEFVTGLSGSTFSYPNDRYEAYLEVVANTLEGHGWRPVSLSLEGHVTAGGCGFKVTKGVSRGVVESRQGQGRVFLELVRSEPVKAYAGMVLTLQWLLALSAVSVAVRVLIFGRDPELAMFTWLTAMLFALPPLRNVMVGVPPIGIYVDFLGFLCCQGIVGCSLAAVVFSWHVRARASRPPAK